MSLPQPSPQRATAATQANGTPARNVLTSPRTPRHRSAPSGPNIQSSPTREPSSGATGLSNPNPSAPPGVSGPTSPPVRRRPIPAGPLELSEITPSSTHSARCIACAARAVRNPTNRNPAQTLPTPPAARARPTATVRRPPLNGVQNPETPASANNQPAQTRPRPAAQGERNTPQRPAAPATPARRRPINPPAQPETPPPRPPPPPKPVLTGPQALLNRLPLVLYIPAPTDESLSSEKGKASTSATKWADNWVKSELPYVTLEENRAVCPICMSDFEEPRRRKTPIVGKGAVATTSWKPVEPVNKGPWEPLRQLPCKHVFHKSCVDPWFIKGAITCPYCRKSVNDVASRPVWNGS